MSQRILKAMRLVLRFINHTADPSLTITGMINQRLMAIVTTMGDTVTGDTAMAGKGTVTDTRTVGMSVREIILTTNTHMRRRKNLQEEVYSIMLQIAQEQ